MGLFDYELRTTQKSEGGWLWFKVGMISLYVIYTLAYLAVVFKTAFVAIGAILPLTLWILVLLTWRYVNPDYLYTIESGMIKFTVIYGNRTKKQRVSAKISECIEIAPVEMCKELIKSVKPERVYNALPSKKCDTPYALLFKDSSGKLSVLYITTTHEAIKSLKFYNKNTKQI